MDISLIILIVLSVLGLCLLLLDTAVMFNVRDAGMYTFTVGVWGTAMFVVFGVAALLIGFDVL